MNDIVKPVETKLETLEVVIERSYWPMGKVTAMRGDEVVEIAEGGNLIPGDIVKLPKKEAAKLINIGAAKMPDMD